MRPFAPAFLLLAPLGLLGCGDNIKTQHPRDSEDTDVEGTPPDIFLPTTAFDFGTLPLGERVSTVVTVQNLGGETLTISSVSTASPFSVSPSTLSVQGGGTSTVTVTVDVEDYLPHEDVLTFVSDDADAPTVDVSLSVTAVTDEDGDGYDLIDAGGDDCDDTDANVYPGAADAYYDDIDSNCDGLSDWDQDQDGYESDAHNTDPEAGGGDCLDLDPSYHPGATDEPYDNRDTNCDDADDYDQDGDGSRSDEYGSGTDCDDTDPAVNTEGVETFNGKDDDCEGTVDQGATAVGASYVYGAAGNYDQVGYATAFADLNDDGYDDVIVGSPYSGAGSASSSGRGAVSVFLANPLPVSGTEIGDADNYFRGSGTTDGLGMAVSSVGDFDGDGTDDLAFSATGATSGAGEVYVLAGTDAASGGDTDTAIFTFTAASGNAAGEGIGSEIDLDGDGTYDLVATYSDSSANAVAIMYGPATGTIAISVGDAVYTTDGTGSAFSRNAPVGGDVDGDGYMDLLLADGAADTLGLTDNGALWALFGQAGAYATAAAEDIETVATVLVEGEASSEGAAWAVSLGGDIAGDDASELWIYNSGVALYGIEGGASRRSPFDPAAEASVTYSWGSASFDVDRMSAIGDWTGDGLSDLLVVAEDGSGSYGRSEIFGSETWDGGVYDERSDLSASLLGSSTDSNGNLGAGQAAVPGDVDNDGDMDLVTGDPDYDSGAGRAYVFLNTPVD